MTATLTMPDGHAEAIAAFRAFHRELRAVRAAIARRDWRALADPGAAAAEPASLARAVFARLCRAIVVVSGRRDADAARNGLVEPGYVIAAFADEALLDSPPWPGQEAWPTMLLEEGLYGSRIAGERLFEVAETLIAMPTPRAQPVASVLLLALSLGFRGRYRGVGDGGAVARIATRLHGALFRGAAPSVAGAEALLTDAPLHLLQAEPGRLLPTPRPWLLATLGLAVAYVIGSQILWWLAVDPILDAARQITAGPGGPGF